MNPYILGIIFAAFIGISLSTEVPYTAFRMTMHENQVAETFNTTLFQVINSMSFRFGDFELQFGSGFFSAKFKMLDFNCPVAGYFKDEVKSASIQLSPHKLFVEHKGHTISFMCEYKYQFELLGMLLFANKAVARIYSNDMSISQVVVERHFLSSFKMDYNYTIETEGWDILGSFSKWSQELIHDKASIKIVERISSEITLQSKDTWGKWLNIISPYAPKENYTINFYNSIRDADQIIPHYYTVSFKTIGLLDWDPVVRSYFIREVRTEPKIENKVNCQVCVAKATLPHILDMQRVAKEFLIAIDSTKVLPSGTLKDLITLIPSLANSGDSSSKVKIGCNVGNPILRLADDSEDSLLVQARGSCTFATETSDSVLVVALSVRGKIFYNVEVKNSSMVITGKLVDTSLYHWTPNMKVDGTAALYGYMAKIVSLLEERALPIEMVVQNLPVQCGKQGVVNKGKDEICVDYK